MPGWGGDCVEAVLPLLPQLLASAPCDTTCDTTPLHLGALRCARAIFAAVGHEQPPQPPPEPPAPGLLTAASLAVTAAAGGGEAAACGGEGAACGGEVAACGGEAASARTRALRQMLEPSRLRAMADALHGPHVEVS